MLKNLILAKLLLICAGIVFGESPSAEEPSVTDTTLTRFIGTWDMQLTAHNETFGDRGGPGEGMMVCEWGTMNAWVDCDMDSIYDGLGRYALTIVLHRLAEDGAIGAFVTNSFGGGRMYVGHWQNGTELVFHDAWVDPSKKWEYQKTTYRFPNADSIEYAIEVSKDNESYFPHSSGKYVRH